MDTFKPSDLPGVTAWLEARDGKLADRLLEETGRPSNLVLTTADPRIARSTYPPVQILFTHTTDRDGPP